MRKQLIFLISLVFLFSSFTVGPVDDPQVQETKADSTIVTHKVEFQNPKIIVNDHRSAKILSESFNNAVEVNSELVDVVESMSDYIPYFLELQERRYNESRVDLLSRQTGLSTSEINKAYERHTKYKATTYTVYGLLFCIAMLALNRVYRIYGEYTDQYKHLIILYTLMFATAYFSLKVVELGINENYYYLQDVINMIK